MIQYRHGLRNSLRQLLWVVAGIYFSQTSVIYFCWLFNCPYIRVSVIARCPQGEIRRNLRTLLYVEVLNFWLKCGIDRDIISSWTFLNRLSIFNGPMLFSALPGHHTQSPSEQDRRSTWAIDWNHRFIFLKLSKQPHTLIWTLSGVGMSK